MNFVQLVAAITAANILTLIFAVTAWRIAKDSDKAPIWALLGFCVAPLMVSVGALLSYP